jgi:DNA-binding NarL/FixJ family response regulator
VGGYLPLRPGATDDEFVEERPGELEEETQVLALLLAGLTDQTVAGQLDVSLRTVRRGVHQLMAKAGVESRIQLGRAVARTGWM